MGGKRCLCALLVMLVIINMVTQGPQIGRAQVQSCRDHLGNLNVCAPFVVPGGGSANPGPDCCSSLQAVDHECLCNTLRIAARLPSQCGLPPVTCG
ncbi:Bifunctional inhibitor/plant lipid transfer protein/seed storage helical domain [Dillenia turbinata]|uniref:Bifunctional inhibitor/plant lipid transfer protein/seed storage helical domain n=1 Tax=Dillenia turbinata TaxID=194707 RepID=A0AAN8Z640_9MAGN